MKIQIGGPDSIKKEKKKALMKDYKFHVDYNALPTSLVDTLLNVISEYNDHILLIFTVNIP